MKISEGVRYASWDYDCQGRATGSEHAGGADKVRLAYSGANDAGTSTTVVTNYTGDPANPQTATHTYRYQITGGKALNTGVDQPCTDCGPIASRTYDANGNIKEYTDWNGNKTSFVFDLTRNLETSRTEGVGTAAARTFTTEWHASYRLPLRVSEPKRITTYVLDVKGNVLTRTEQATTDQSGAAGFDAVKIGAVKTWSYTYNALGKVATITGPRTDAVDVTRLDYDSIGNLTTVTNALGQVTTMADYNADRQVGKITGPNGIVTVLLYNLRGWLISKSVQVADLKETVTYDYDALGQLTKVTMPDTTSIVFDYDDAHRLRSVVDSAGNSTSYTLDARGNRTNETVSDARGNLRRQIFRVFDGLNRLRQMTGGAQ